MEKIVEVDEKVITRLQHTENDKQVNITHHLNLKLSNKKPHKKLGFLYVLWKGKHYLIIIVLKTYVKMSTYT